MPIPIAMNTPANLQLLRIRRISKNLAFTCLALSFLLPVLVIAYWADASTAQLAVRAHLAANAIQEELHLWQRGLGALITEIPVLLSVCALMKARQCFRGFAQGALFTAEAVGALRGFAAWTMWAAISGFLIGPLLSVCLTFNNPKGFRHVAIGLGTDLILTFFFAAMVWLMSSIIQQGQLLADENQSFV
jgi:Protein of unknown function (DUF2975)